jgi:hypothetical protein
VQKGRSWKLKNWKVKVGLRLHLFSESQQLYFFTSKQFNTTIFLYFPNYLNEKKKKNQRATNETEIAENEDHP